jgi:tRNA(Ile2) C34 agmatinyltransferase TiaS
MDRKRNGHSFRMRACQRCGGDAYLDKGDDNEWRCLQCGRSLSAVRPQVAANEKVTAGVN